MKSFLLDRLDERSTWRAIIALLTVLGVGLSHEQTEAIIAAGVAIGALVEALLPEPAGRIGVRKSTVSDKAKDQPGTRAVSSDQTRDDPRGIWGQDH